MSDNTLQYILKRTTLVDENHLRTEIRNSMFLRYALILITILFLSVFRHRLPFPYVQLLVVCSVFMVVNVLLHLLSMHSTIRRSIYSLLPYVDMVIAPFVFQYTGGFLSPFLLTQMLTAIGSGIMYTDDRHVTKRVNAFLLASYLSVALLQKFGVLYNAVAYSREMMHESFFFYFIVVIMSILITAGMLLVELLNRNIHQTLDELTGSFDTIIKGTTAVVDKDFFTNLAQRSSETFRVRCVYIAEIGQQYQKLQTLVIWNNGKTEDNYSLPFASTFAQEIIRHPERRLFEPELAGGYPEDPVLTLFPVCFIFGIPLYDTNKKPIGVLLALNDTPVKTLHLIDPLFLIFASRAAAELERKITDEKRMMVEQQLAHAQKIEAIGHLAGGIAHDFNNIINVISGFASILQKKLGVDHPQAHYTGRIIDAAKNAESMTGQLSMFVKNDKVKSEPVNVHSVINNTVFMLRQLVGNGIELNTDLKASHATTIGEISLLQNALLNLGINARDACENRHGIISYSTGIVNLDYRSILCQSFSIEPGTFIRITVSDNGSGMSKEVVKRIFEPFFTTKPKEKGTGLGLANVWRYIETFKGAIEVQSEIKAGSSFILYLPVHGEIVSPSPPPAAHRQPATATILIVDDESSIREIYSEVLIESGYTVYTANDGSDALEFVNKGSVTIDLILLDMVMPRLNGPGAFHAIRKRCPKIKVLLMSGFAAREEIATLLREPGTDFYRKSSDREQLLRQVSLLLSR